MPMTVTHTYTSFQGDRRLESGPLALVALAIKRAMGSDASEPILIFDDRTGRSIDIDIRGSDAEVTARYAANDASNDAGELKADSPRGRGRPKLGVIAREVTLLPRHWEWLNAQPGGASVALRKLIDEARRVNSERDGARAAQERAYYFMSAIAGDMPGFEEASRALFAQDGAAFARHVAQWPTDVREHAKKLATVSSSAG